LDRARLAWWPFAAAFVVAARLPVVLVTSFGAAAAGAQAHCRRPGHRVRPRDRRRVAVVAARPIR
jgi:hypothetical protein